MVVLRLSTVMGSGTRVLCDGLGATRSCAASIRPTLVLGWLTTAPDPVCFTFRFPSWRALCLPMLTSFGAGPKDASASCHIWWQFANWSSVP